MHRLTRATGLPAPALWFLTGTFASNIGNGMHTLAAGVLLYQQTGSIAAFGAVVVIEQAATFLMQVAAGPLVDHGDPKRAAIMAELVRGWGVLALAMLLAASPGNALAVILAMTLIIRFVHVFHRAGTFALSPTLVGAGDLTKLNGWFSACQQGGQLVGFAAAGLVVAQCDTAATFGINGLSFLVSAVTLSRINVTTDPGQHQAPARAPASIRRTVLLGWIELARLLWRDLRLAGLTIVSTADNVALILFNLLLAPLVTMRLAADPTWMSLLAAGFAFGAMGTSGVASQCVDRFGAYRSVLTGLAGQMMCFAALWSFELPSTMLLLAVLLGGFNTISWTTAITAVQLEAPPAVRGRLAMARSALTAAITAPLVALSAAISQSVSPSAPLLLSSCVCAAFLALAILSIRPRVIANGRSAATSRQA